MSSDTAENTARAALARALGEQTDLPSSVVDEIAFHMADWLLELEELARVLVRPQSVSEEEIYKAVLAFLIHAPEHIVAASELLTGIKPEGIFDSRHHENPEEASD